MPVSHLLRLLRRAQSQPCWCWSRALLSQNSVTPLSFFYAGFGIGNFLG